VLVRVAFAPMLYEGADERNQGPAALRVRPVHDGVGPHTVNPLHDGRCLMTDESRPRTSPGRRA